MSASDEIDWLARAAAAVRVVIRIACPTCQAPVGKVCTAQPARPLVDRVHEQRIVAALLVNPEAASQRATIAGEIHKAAIPTIEEEQ